MVRAKAQMQGVERMLEDSVVRPEEGIQERSLER